MRHGILLAQHRLGADIGLADPALAGVEHPHRRGVVDQLQHVAVAGDDVDRKAALVPGHQGADDVIRLVPVNADPSDPQGGQSVDDERHLRSQIVGDLLGEASGRGMLLIGFLPGRDGVRHAGHPMGLVARDQVDPPLRAPVVVPAGDEFGGMVGIDQRGEHVDEATDRIGGVLGRALPLVRNSVEGPEIERGGIQQQQAFPGHASTLSTSPTRVSVWNRPTGASWTC